MNPSLKLERAGKHSCVWWVFPVWTEEGALDTMSWRESQETEGETVERVHLF